jgi:acyl transferase domain-containing protein
MGAVLYQTQPTFSAALDQCAELLRPYLDQPLLRVIHPEPCALPPLLHETAYTQPALFALEYALAQLWLSWGVVPDAVHGHSIGEYTAACVVGVFSLEDAIRLVAERARLMQALPPVGRMATVFASAARVAEVLAGQAGAVATAAVNGPESTVISGEAGAVEGVLRQLQAQGVVAKPLTVSHAFHSPLLDPMLADLERAAAAVTATAPRIPLIANLTGKPMTEAPGAEYWRDHARRTVQFTAGMASLRELGCEVFLELGPGSTLLALGKMSMPGHGTWLPSLNAAQDDWQVLLRAAGALYVRGVPLSWTGFDRDYSRRRLTLPGYPFEKQRCWLESKRGADRPAAPKPASAPRAALHPLLGRRVR